MLYALPSAALGFAFFFVSTQALYFGTDVLRVAPNVIGTLLATARIWDAVSDPVAGYLSDITRTRWGRRRPWFLAASVPLALGFIGVWLLPASAPEASRGVWLAVGVLLFYTAHTAASMPHDALGAELAPGYRDRTRVFAWKRVAFTAGMLAFIWFAPRLSGESTDAFVALAWPAAIALGLGFAAAAIGLREPESRQRPRQVRAPSLFRSFSSVWRNLHARVLISVFFAQQLAVGLLLVGMPYFSEYVLNDPDALRNVFLVFFSATLISIPVWERLGTVFQKKSLVVAAMLGVGSGMAVLSFVGPGSPAILYVAAAFAGLAAGGSDILLPSLQADVIDADELETGARNEGIYFATWALTLKLAYAAAWILAGFALSIAGFEAGAEQTPRALLAVRVLTGGAPFVIYLLAILSFARFRLDEAEHRRIRSLIDARAIERLQP